MMMIGSRAEGPVEISKLFNVFNRLLVTVASKFAGMSDLWL